MVPNLQRFCSFYDQRQAFSCLAVLHRRIGILRKGHCAVGFANRQRRFLDGAVCDVTHLCVGPFATALRGAVRSEGGVDNDAVNTENLPKMSDSDLFRNMSDEQLVALLRRKFSCIVSVLDDKFLACAGNGFVVHGGQRQRCCLRITVSNKTNAFGGSRSGVGKNTDVENLPKGLKKLTEISMVDLRGQPFDEQLTSININLPCHGANAGFQNRTAGRVFGLGRR